MGPAPYLSASLGTADDSPDAAMIKYVNTVLNKCVVNPDRTNAGRVGFAGRVGPIVYNAGPC